MTEGIISAVGREMVQDAQNMGFAISSATVQSVLTQLQAAA